MQKRMITFLIVTIYAFSISFSNIAFADNLKDKSKQLKDVKNNINNLKEKIEDVKEEKVEVTVQINRIESQISRVNSSISKLEGQIKLTKNNISKKNDELNIVIKDFNHYKELYMRRLKAMYMNGSTGYLEILLSAQDFSDLISRTDLLKKVIAFDQKTLKEIKIKQENINSKKKDLEATQKKLLGYESQEESKRAELANAEKNKLKYYEQLKDEQARLERELSEEQKESKNLEAQIRIILERLAKNNDKTKYTGERVGVVRAVDIGRIPQITSYYGNRFHPILKKYKMHTGVDVGIPTGTPIYAMSDGEVIIAETMTGYGKVVAINHGSSISSLYAHNSKILVKIGQKVSKGQMIAKAGSTGYSTGPHLHFEVRLNGTPVNPLPYLIIGK